MKLMLCRKYILLLIFFIFLFVCQANANDITSQRPKIGLVLSGGGARGMAHIGILKMIDSLQIPVDYIAGTSMGGIVGALYASGYSAAEMEQLVLDVDWNEMFTDRPQREDLPYLQKKDDGKYGVELGLKGFTPTIPGGLIEGQKIYLLFSNLTASMQCVSDFSKLPIPFKCVAVDLVSGREVILDKGSLPKAMRATMAIPTVFSPVEWGDSLLIDGGVLNNFPADVVKAMGADIIIGVNVGSPLKEKKDLTTIISLLEQTMVITDYYRQQENKKLCDLFITPDLSGYSLGDFDQESVKNIIALGDTAALANKNNLIELKEKYFGKYKNEKKGERQSKKQLLKIEESSQRIFSLDIKGNDNIPFNFIYNHMGIKPGNQYDKDLLTERINELYALGYFNQITYEIEKIDDNNIRLHLNVKEKPQRKLRLGYKYDNFYELVGLIGLQASNLPFTGFRVETSLQFAGLFKFDFSISYPSRQLDMPIIPYFRFTSKDIPIDIYHPENGKVVMSYGDRTISTAIGLGFRLGNIGLLEAEYNYEYVDIKPNFYSQGSPNFSSFKDDLHKVQLNFIIDMLDDVILPHRGLKLDAKYEASSKSLNSDVNYQQFQVQGDFYKEIAGKQCIHLQGFYTSFIDNLPIYKNITLGGPDNFVGVHYGQIEGNRFVYGRLDYRYEYKKDIFLKLISNMAFYETNPSQNISKEKVLIGYGVGVKFLSIIGPFEVIFSRGSQSIISNDSFTNQLYFTAGFYF